VAKSLPAQFSTEKDKIHYKPIYLVDIDALGYHWATRAVTVRMMDGGSWNLSINGPHTGLTDSGETFISDGVAKGDIHTLVGTPDLIFTIDRVASETRVYWTQSRSGGGSGASYRIDRTYAEALKGSSPGRGVDLGIGLISQSIDLLGGISTTGNVTLSLLNQDLLSDSLLSGKLDNAEISIRLLFDDGTQIRFDESDLIFKGVIDDYQFNKEAIEIFCVKSDIKSNITVPKKTIDKQGFPNAPDESIGSRIQLVYGNFWDGNDPDYNKFDLVPAILTDPESMEYTISDHILTGLTLASSVYMDAPQINTYVSLTLDNGIIFNSVPPAKVKLESPIKGGLAVRRFAKGDRSTINDFYKIMDRTESYVTIGNNQKLYVKLPELSSFGKLSTATNKIFIRYFLGTVSGSGTAVVRYHQASGSTGKNITSADSDTINTYIIDTDDSDRTPGDWTWEELASTEFGITCDANISVQLKNFVLRISDVFIFIAGQPLNTPIPRSRSGNVRRFYRLRQVQPSLAEPPRTGVTAENILIQCRGKKYGDWLKAPGRSNSVFVGNAIKTAAGIVEDLLRHAGNSNNDIDMDSFDTAIDVASGSQFWGLIQEERLILDTIDDICRQSRAKLYKSSADKFKIMIYDSTQSLISDGTFKENPTMTGSAYDDNPIVEEPTISKISMDDIVNSVKVNYHFDFIKSTPRRTTMISIEKKPTNTFVDEPDTGIDGSTDPITFDVDINGTDDASEINVNDYVLIDQEIMKVTSVNQTTDDITCDRAQKGSIIAAHQDNTPIFILVSNSDNGGGTRDQNGSAPNNREDLAMLSVAKYGIVNEFQIDADWIRDNTQALNLRNFLFDRLLNRLYTIEFNTFLNAVHVEIADFINIQHRSIAGLFSDMTTKKWEVLGLGLAPNADAGQIKITAIEV